MRTDIKELIQLISKEHANEEQERRALRELYDEYCIPFYFTALCFFKNEKKAIEAATEAFRRIESSAYRFEEELKAEYWFFDVIYTLCANAAEIEKGQDAASIPNIPKELAQAPEVYIKIYSELGVAEIASLTGKKRAEINKILKNKDVYDNIKGIAPQYCPDYWEEITDQDVTGFEEYSEVERIKTVKEKRTQKRSVNFKRIVAIVLVVAFVCSAITVGILLITKKFGSDIDKNEANEDITLQFNNSIAVAEMDGAIYYCAENAMYKFDTATKKSVKISDDFPKEILSDGIFIYYRNNKDGYLYRIDGDGKNKISLCNVPGAAMALHNGKVYFSNGDGIYCVPSGGADFSEAELLLDISTDANLYCVDTAVHSSGNVFFASGIGHGVHHITEFNGEPSVDGFFNEEVYTLIIDGDKLFFDCKDATGKILLYCFNIEDYLNAEKNKKIFPKVVSDSEGKNIELVTGAFDVSEGKIYFVGEENDVSVLYMLDEEKKLSKVTEIPSNEANARKKLVISDVHVFGERIYYFCSDGKAGGDRAFFEYNMNTSETNKIFES